MRNIQMHEMRSAGKPTNTNRRGSVAPLAAAVMVILFAMVAFAIDMGQIVHVDTELQRTADACALAAVQALPDQEEAIRVAQAVAVENYRTSGPDLEVSDIEFGEWDPETATFVPTLADPNGVRVTVQRTAARGNSLSLFFAPILGHSQADVVASSIAMYDHEFCGALIGIEWIRVPGGPTTDSYHSGDGAYTSQSPRHNGSLCSDGPIVLVGTPQVNGHANAGRNHKTTMTGNAEVTGSTTPRLRPLNLPSIDMSHMTAENDNVYLPPIQKGNKVRNATDNHQSFKLDGNQTYTFPEGEYYFHDFILTGDSTVHFEGPTTILLSGNLDTAGGNVFNHTGIPSNLRIFMDGGTARITAKVDFYGMIYAPFTDLIVAGNADWYGALVGKTLTLIGDGNIHYDEDLNVGDDLLLPKRVALVQ